MIPSSSLLVLTRCYPLSFTVLRKIYGVLSFYCWPSHHHSTKSHTHRQTQTKIHLQNQQTTAKTRQWKKRIFPYHIVKLNPFGMASGNRHHIPFFFLSLLLSMASHEMEWERDLQSWNLHVLKVAHFISIKQPAKTWTDFCWLNLLLLSFSLYLCNVMHVLCFVFTMVSFMFGSFYLSFGVMLSSCLPNLTPGQSIETLPLEKALFHVLVCVCLPQ